MGPRIFIIGSCVSRDVFRLPHTAIIADYVARSSLASAFDHLPWEADWAVVEASIASPFQRRLVTIDLQKRLPSLLRETDYDLILLDFIDERFNLIELNGQVATLSNELSVTNLHKTSPATKVEPTDPQRHEKWRYGLSQLLEIAGHRGVPVFLNKVLWATHDNLGNAFDPSSIQHGNALLEKLYSEVPDEVRVISHSPETLVGDVDHVWGRSPFHYSRAVYETVLKELGVAQRS